MRNACPVDPRMAASWTDRDGTAVAGVPVRTIRASASILDRSSTARDARARSRRFASAAAAPRAFTQCGEPARANRESARSSMHGARRGASWPRGAERPSAGAAHTVFLDRSMLHRTSFLAAVFALALAAPSAPRVATASPLGVGAGTDWSSVANGATVTSIYGYGSLSAGRMGLALGGLHYDDGSITAAGPLVAAVAPVAPSLLARAWWTQYFGDGGFHAWRLRGGPEWTLPRNATVGAFFAYLENDRDGVQRSGSLEIAIPVNARWTGKADAGAARLPGAITATQAALGVAWTPFASVELSGEAGLAYHGAFLGSASAAGGGGGGGGPLTLPLGLGGSGGGNGRGRTTATGTVDDVEPTLSLGLRIALP